MFSIDQMPTEIEEIVNRGMSSHEPLGLRYRLELAHPPVLELSSIHVTVRPDCSHTE